MSSLVRKMRRDRARLDNRRGQAIIDKTPLTEAEMELGWPVPAGRVRRADRGYEGPVKPDKGLQGGSCNRTACQDPGATWFNHSTRAWYCAPCARLINAACREDSFVRNLGHDLCTPALPEGSVADPDASSHA